MKKLYFFLALLLAGFSATAQKVYFVYIQSETDQPFFVKMNEKISSSTASGYIIIPKLVDSTYQFTIGFPQNKWPDQSFSVSINKKDHGYLLKNFGEKGWGLFDLQTLAVQMAIGGKASIDNGPLIDNKDVSAFTEILSRAADDPSLKQKPVAQPMPPEKKADIVKQEVPKQEKEVAVVKETVEAKEPVENKSNASVVTPAVITKPAEEKEVVTAAVKKEETPPVVTPAKEVVEFKKEEPATVVAGNTMDTVAKATEQTLAAGTNTTPPKEEPVVVTKNDEPYKMSTVKKWAESSTTDGFGIVYIDGDGTAPADTIRLVIPNPKPVVNIAKEQPKEEPAFIKTSELPAATTTVEPDKTVAEQKATVATMPKSSCKVVGTGDDFVKLRKRMAAATSDDGMIEEAKKYYKLKCFSTWQMKNLGVLFLTDEGKYKFFDASYPYVTDPQAFASLQSEIRDEYYAGRFKAMLRN